MQALEVARTAGEGGEIALSFRGALDATTGARAQAAVAEAEAEAPKALVLDFSPLDFMDSTGLQVLLDADVRAARNGHRLELVLGEGAARRVVELADALDHLTAAAVREG